MKPYLVLAASLALFACATPPAAVLQDITVPGSRSLGPYTQAVRAGDYVFLSGIVAFDAQSGTFAPARIEPQTRQVFANLKTVLAAAGLGLDDVVKTTVYLKNPADFAKMNPVYADYFKGHKPARTTVPGVDWGRPDVLIEIEAIAYAPRR